VALTDATIDNGCVWVTPGVHRHGTLAHRNTPIGFQCFEDPPDAVPVPVRAGSIVVFTSLTPHATGVNVTDELRIAYIVQFAPDGAVALRGESDAPALRRDRQDDAERQFLVVKDGRPVHP
jgi:ectoine hydroxylase-related dioxygenase (phytanoyl-CoA dioxygenase family)